MFGGKKRIRRSRAKRGGNLAANALVIGGKGRSMSQSQSQSQSLAKTRGRGRGRSSGIGGYWAAVLEQAIVPLTLLGIQQTYGRKRHLKGRTFKRKRHR